MAPEASVIIPHYDQQDALRACLESVTRQSLSAERYEIIVADNGTPGGLDDLRAAFPEARFVTAPERGAAPARNEGMAAARGRAFAFIDADCVADERWLEEGLASLAGADLSGGDVRVSVAAPESPSPVECFESVFAFRQRMYVERKRFSVTANLFADARAARKTGGFRNGVAEDLDWCRRAQALGFHLSFNDRSIVVHPARREWPDLVQKWDRLIRERWNGFGARGAARRILWAGLAGATALSAGPHLWAIATSGRLKTTRQRLAAASVLARIRLWRAWRMLKLLRPIGRSGAEGLYEA